MVGNAISDVGPTETWIVDTTAPTADIVDVTPDPRDEPVDSITIRFSEPVTGFDLSDLWLTREDVVMQLTDAQTLTTTDGGVTWVLGNLADLTSPGNFELRLRADGSNIKDAAGNLLAADATDTWSGGTTGGFFDLYVRGAAWSPAFKTYLEQKGWGDDVLGYQVANSGGQAAAPTENPDRILPWINMDELVVRYATAPASGIPTRDSIVLTSAQGVTYTVVSVAPVAGDPRAFVFTLDKPLGGGNPATGVAPTAQQDGDRITVTALGAGPLGSTASTRLDVLQGDADHTGESGTHSVLAADFSLVKKKFFTTTTSTPNPADPTTDYSAFADVNGSGDILANDFSEVKKRFFHTLPAAPAQPAPATVAGTDPLILSSTTTKDLFGSTPILG
jgi:hypothetical protein